MRRLTEDDFWARVDRSGGPDSCWPYTGPLTKGRTFGGYGTFGPALCNEIRAHRVAYTLTFGSIKDNPLVLDHVCHTNDPTCGGGGECLHRRCVNPSHLELVSISENSRRAAGKPGRRRGPLRRQVCHKGHEWLDESDLYVYPDGSRECRTCRRERMLVVAAQRGHRAPSDPDYRRRSTRH